MFCQRKTVFLSGLLEIITVDHLNTLGDNDIVNLFLYGNPEFPYQ